MDELPENLYTPEQVGRIDRCVIEHHGGGDGVLMERAGRAAYRVLRRFWPDARRIVLLCGGGNNGGDGYVIARHAAADGLDVRLVALSNPDGLGGDAAGAARASRASVTPLVQTETFEATCLEGADVIVDALLGTGLDRPVEGRYAAAVEAANASAAAVLAVDIPSGLNGATGAVMGDAVRADVTVTFIGVKQGLLTGAAADHVGELLFAGLDVPAEAYGVVEPNARRVSAKAVAAALPPRQRAAHKGDFGHVLLAGGDLGMGGALRIAAEAALRAGAGLVSAATRAEHVTALLAGRPEVMCHGLGDTFDIDSLAVHASCLALGPGLGQRAWGRAVFGALIDRPLPMVIDADALNLLAEGTVPSLREDRVLTPHPGEAARLLGVRASEVQANRFAAARAIAERFGGVVVLKGAGTVIADTRNWWVCDAGNPGMAAGGMGDALTGVIAALLAQGLSPVEAATAGVRLHGDAADRVARRQGERGMVALDLMVDLPGLVNP